MLPPFAVFDAGVYLASFVIFAVALYVILTDAERSE